VIWLYAVCEQPERPLPCVSGLDGATLEGIADGPLLAVASLHAGVPEARAADALWAHERVVEAVQSDRAVLPIRFGTRRPDAACVRAALAEGRDELLAGLDRVRGRVEVAVRAMRMPETADDGVGYLRRRREAAVLYETLEAFAVEARRAPERTADELLRAAYLLEPPALTEFVTAVERLQRAHPRAALVCTGPWPAYSFVEPLK
jgi:Gas vesicle synthesis protein GvpL/GvpF